jgi:hypothetical protein
MNYSTFEKSNVDVPRLPSSFTPRSFESINDKRRRAELVVIHDASEQGQILDSDFSS